jgi:hypothetical protein
VCCYIIIAESSILSCTLLHSRALALEGELKDIFSAEFYLYNEAGA